LNTSASGEWILRSRPSPFFSYIHHPFEIADSALTLRAWNVPYIFTTPWDQPLWATAACTWVLATMQTNSLLCEALPSALQMAMGHWMPASFGRHGDLCLWVTYILKQ
jgi:hypothetical protein